MSQDKYNWSCLSKYRNSIYGVSIILVILFHFFDRVRHLNGIFAEISRLYWILIGSVGVDIFLIMSGVSLFYSLKKNSNVLEFYIKRCKRIIVPYLIVGFIFWYIKDIALLKLGTVALIKDMLFVTFFTNGDRTFWYILAIMIIYLFYPLIFKIYSKIDKVSEIVTMFLIGAIVGVNYLIYLYDIDLYNNIEIMLTRFPAIILGAYCGKRVYDKAKIRKVDFIVLGASIIVDLSINFFRIIEAGYIGEKILRYVQISRGIVAIFIVSLVLAMIKNIKVEGLLSKVGEYSLDLYLVHVAIIEIFDAVHIPVTKLVCFLICIIITIGLVQSLKRFSNVIYKILEKG